MVGQLKSASCDGCRVGDQKSGSFIKAHELRGCLPKRHLGQVVQTKGLGALKCRLLLAIYHKEELAHSEGKEQETFAYQILLALLQSLRVSPHNLEVIGNQRSRCAGRVDSAWAGTFKSSSDSRCLDSRILLRSSFQRTSSAAYKQCVTLYWRSLRCSGMLQLRLTRNGGSSSPVVDTTPPPGSEPGKVLLAPLKMIFFGPYSG